MNHPAIDTASYQSVPKEFNEVVNAHAPLSQQTPHNHRFSGWKSYATMLGFLGTGIATAAVQHFYYSYLDGREVDQVSMSQSWAIRIGTAFAFLFKTCLVASVGVAYCQGFWYSVRRNSVRLYELDAIFSILNNPLNFIHKNIYLRRKVLVVLALICWLLPIAAIFSPGALTGKIFMLIADLSCHCSFDSFCHCWCPGSWNARHKCRVCGDWQC
jgi:hypothetical protein